MNNWTHSQSPADSSQWHISLNGRYQFTVSGFETAATDVCNTLNTNQTALAAERKAKEEAVELIRKIRAFVPAYYTEYFSEINDFLAKHK